MSQSQKIALLFLRLTLGCLFLYAGISKILNPSWSAASYIQGSQTADWFFELFMRPSVLPLVNGLVKYGLTLLGISLILGVFVRLSSLLGSLLMLLFYIPILDFPYVGKTSFIVDDHIIFIAALMVLTAFRAGRYWGLEKWCANLPLCSRFPRLRQLLG